MLKVRPILDRVIIKQDEAATNVGAFVIPDSAREKPRQGEVVAVGPGAMKFDGGRIPMMTKVGDKVIYAEFAGAEVVIEGERYIVIEENKILLIL